MSLNIFWYLYLKDRTKKFKKDLTEQKIILYFGYFRLNPPKSTALRLNYLSIILY